MILLMLGASYAQLAGIRLARSLGHKVITCDNLPDSVGHLESDGRIWASTFEPEAILNQLQLNDIKIDGVMTMGTDQPVLSGAIIAQTLGLFSHLDVKTATAVTNKREMKNRFTACGLPTVPYLFLNNRPEERKSAVERLRQLTFPVVVKPLDSQGQRGIFLLDSPAAVLASMDKVLSYSREDAILVESYYPSTEVTVTGWAQAGRVYVLSITDRVTFGERDQLGICLSHELPTRHMADKGKELVSLTKQIARCFNLQNGPLYFQFLIGEEGIKVNEIACRIGGAYESRTIPQVTGFDLTRAVILSALGLYQGERHGPGVLNYSFTEPKSTLTLQFFFAEPCTLGPLVPVDKIMSLPGVLEMSYFKKEGDKIGEVSNATDRVGYFILEAPDKAVLEKRLRLVYSQLAVPDKEGVNKIIHRPFY